MQIDLVKFVKNKLLGNLTDVEVSSESLGDGLVFDTGSSKWKNLSIGTNSFFKKILPAKLTIPTGQSKIVTDTIDASDYDIEIEADGILEIT